MIYVLFVFFSWQKGSTAYEWHVKWWAKSAWRESGFANVVEVCVQSERSEGDKYMGA
jgi:hypothetical protein